MLSKEKQNYLSGANGCSRDLYVDRVNAQGTKALTPEEEKARIRKAFAAFLKREIAKDPELARDPAICEFLEYHDTYEAIKSVAKEELNL